MSQEQQSRQALAQAARVLRRRPREVREGASDERLAQALSLGAVALKAQLAATRRALIAVRQAQAARLPIEISTQSQGGHGDHQDPQDRARERAA